MKKILLTTLSVAALFALSACAIPAPSEEGDASSSASAESIMTDNVSYTGSIDVATDAKDTHILTLKSGAIVYLQSNDASLNLDAYIGKEVEVRGSAEPILGASDTLLHVQEVTVLGIANVADASSSIASKTFCGGIAGIACREGYECVDDLTDDCDPAQGGEDCGGTCVKSIAATSTSSQAASISASSSSVSTSSARSSPPASSSVAPVPESSSATSVSSSASSVRDDNPDEMLMSKQDYSAALWTQQYCTSHIAYCVSAHKNWYFKSFGATTSSLWHVEFGMRAVDALGDGIIEMKLLPEASARAKGVSGQVVEFGDTVVGFKDWQGDHFEIIAPISLKAAVQFMANSIISYNPGE